MLKKGGVGNSLLVHSFEDHSRSVSSVFVSGDHLFTGSLDNTVKMWDLKPILTKKFTKRFRNASLALGIGNTYAAEANQPINATGHKEVARKTRVKKNTNIPTGETLPVLPKQLIEKIAAHDADTNVPT